MLFRICTNGYHSHKMSFLFAKSLKYSKQLSTFSKIIFYPKLFKTNLAMDSIVSIKKIDINNSSNNSPMKICSVNMYLCLDQLRHINEVINSLEKTMKITVDRNIATHESLLQEFRSNSFVFCCILYVIFIVISFLVSIYIAYLHAFSYIWY